MSRFKTPLKLFDPNAQVWRFTCLLIDSGISPCKLLELKSRTSRESYLKLSLVKVVKWLSERSKWIKRGNAYSQEGMAPLSKLPFKSKEVRFESLSGETSVGKGPENKLDEAFKLESWVRLKREVGSWPMKEFVWIWKSVSFWRLFHVLGSWPLNLFEERSMVLSCVRFPIDSGIPPMNSQDWRFKDLKDLALPMDSGIISPEKLVKWRSKISSD